MHSFFLIFAILAQEPITALKSGDHKRTITVDDQKRVHLIHVPPKYNPKEPMPVVLALHGAMMDAKMMEVFSGLNEAADLHHFIVVYPNGTGPGGVLQTWNAGRFPGELNKNRADDVKYLGCVLDDVSEALNVNKKRIYALGLSNGGMMAYRLAAEMPNRIAAIGSIAGTMVVDQYEPKRPVPVVHFHGTKDLLVPFNGQKKGTAAGFRFGSVEDTIQICAKANGCDDKAVVTEVKSKEDKLKVTRKEYRNGKTDADVVLYVIENGGHTWPGRWAPAFLGLATEEFSATDVAWDFFKRHPLK